jgi:lipoic acid synthetase
VTTDLSPVPAPGSHVAPEGRRMLRIEARNAETPIERKPPWIKVKATMGPEFTQLRGLVQREGLHTVCEEAGCPNIYECWADGTATFMLNGERCTRACGFCLVDTSHPLALDPDEPARVADAVARMGLGFAVLTAVARDDLPDGGAHVFANTIRELRTRVPGMGIEVLIPDFNGEEAPLRAVMQAGPDILNHNLETVRRLQKPVRKRARWERSLYVLRRAKEMAAEIGYPVHTKSSLMVGLGEARAELQEAFEALRAVDCDILTIGQYLRPTAAHAPMVRYYTPEEFRELKAITLDMGFVHVESGPLVRSSYHAHETADAYAARSAAL